MATARQRAGTARKGGAGKFGDTSGSTSTSKSGGGSGGSSGSGSNKTSSAPLPEGYVSISASRSLPGGGSVIVTSEGKVTEKNSKGEVVKQFYVDTNAAGSFISGKTNIIAGITTGQAPKAEKQPRLQTDTEPNKGSLDTSLNLQQNFSPLTPGRASLSLVQKAINDSILKPEKRDKQFTPGGTISAAPPELIKTTKKEQSLFASAFESLKRGVQGKQTKERELQPLQQLEFALSGRSPSGQIKTKDQATVELISNVAGTVGSIRFFGGGAPYSKLGGFSLSGGLKTIDKAGDIVRGTKLAKAISSKGKVGRIVVEGSTRVAELELTAKLGSNIVDVIAPRESKNIVPKSEINKIFNVARTAQIRDEFKAEPSPTIAGTIKEKTKAFFRGSASELFPLGSASKDVFRSTAKSEISKLNLTPTQKNILFERLEQKRRGKGFIQTINILQAEAFANVVGGKELDILYKTGKYPTKQTGALKSAFRIAGTKIVPGAVEGMTAVRAILSGTESQRKPTSGFVNVPGTPAYDSLSDPRFTNQTFNLTRKEFDLLNISQQPKDARNRFEKLIGVAPRNKQDLFVNKIYNIKEPETSEIISTRKGDIIETSNITTSPITQLIVSRKAEATKPTKRFELGKNELTLLGGAGGIATATLFGFAEGGVMFTKTRKKLVDFFGFGADLPELPGDIATNAITSRKVSSKVVGSLPTLTNEQQKQYENAISSTKSQRTSLQQAIFGISKTQTKAPITSKTQAKTPIEAITAPKSSTYTDTFSDVFEMVTEKTSSKQRTQQSSKAFSEVFTNVNTINLRNLYVPPVVLPGGGGGGRYFKTRKKLKRRFMFAPSIFGQITKRGAGSTDLLTGLEPRRGFIVTSRNKRKKRK